jgi:hypothetical protein
LFLDIENANDRSFKRTNLHYYVLQNRGLIISALYSLVRNWKDKGMKDGTLNFTSFPEWAKICGGIMESAEYGNPCVQDKEIVIIEGDSETQNMKALFEVLYSLYKDVPVEKKAMVSIANTEDLFPFWDLEKDRSAQTKFGNLLNKYAGRVLSEIRMIDTTPKDRASRKKYLFTKEPLKNTLLDFGNPGNVGNV